MEAIVESPVSFSPEAVEEIKRLMREDGFEVNKKLRVGVKGGGCSGMSYILGFDEKKDADEEFETDGIIFIMDKAHEMYLCNMQIKWEDGLNSRGFTFSNPNASSTCGCGSSFAV